MHVELHHAVFDRWGWLTGTRKVGEFEVGTCTKCRVHPSAEDCPGNYCEWCCTDECGPHAHHEED